MERTAPLFSPGRQGGAELQVVELLVPLLCAAIIALGVRIQLRLFMYYGLRRLAVFTLRFTGRRLAEQLSWPIVVLVVGAAAMGAGLWLERRLATRADRSEALP